jgi:hypothetical protein
MSDYELLPETTVQTQTAVLAFAGIVGGGLIAYEAGRAIRDGDLFKTDALPKNQEAGTFALLGGLGLFGFMVRDAVKDVGWKPLVLGSVAIFGLSALMAAARR